MAKYTNVAIFPNASFAAGNFTNANNVLNDSTSSYATSEAMSYAASDAIGCQWTPQHIQAVIPIGAIIDSITVRVVAKFSDSGSGSFFKMYRSFDILNVNSTTCEYTDSPNLKFSNSFTTLDYQLPQVSNDFITKGFSARLAFKNTKLASTRTVYVATVKLLVSYTVPEYTLTVNASPPEGGTVTDGGVYESGSTVTATATPNDGFYFSYWLINGEVFGSINPISAVLTADTTVTAVFEPIVFNVTTYSMPIAGGTVKGGGTYAALDTVEITAVPNEGYVFSHWLEIDETAPSFSTKISTDTTFTAVFEKEQRSKIRYGTETAKSVFDTQKNKAKSVWYGNTQIL